MTINEIIAGMRQGAQDFQNRVTGLPDYQRAVAANNKPVVDTFDAIAKSRDLISNDLTNNILGAYGALEGSFMPYANQYFSESRNLAENVLPQINNSLNEVRGIYGPDGQMINNINNLYDNLVVSAQLDAAKNENLRQNNARRSGASMNAIEKAQFDARTNAQKLLNQIEAQRLQGLQSTYNNLFNLEQGLRNERINTANNFQLQPLINLANMRKEIGTGLAGQLMAAYARGAGGGTGGGGTGGASTTTATTAEEDNEANKMMRKSLFDEGVSYMSGLLKRGTPIAESRDVLLNTYKDMLRKSPDLFRSILRAR